MYIERLRQARTRGEVEIPQGVQVELEGPTVKASGPLGSVSKDFSKCRVSIAKVEGKVEVSTDLKGKRGKAILGTVLKKLSNMMKGVRVPYRVDMKVVLSHFPPTVKAQGSVLSIENFMGEKTPRRVQIPPGIKVEVSGQDISITGSDIDTVTQLAGTIETATMTKYKDQRIYLDGIYVQSKGYEDELSR